MRIHYEDTDSRIIANDRGKENTLSTRLETFLLDLKEGATATVRFLFRTIEKSKRPQNQ